jgi:Ca2+-binding EF-hand superfamily protein
MFLNYASSDSIVLGSAVLLEAFFASMKNADNSSRMAKQLEQQTKHAAALDPLFATLANFSSPQHFLMQVDLVFEIFDVNDNGFVDYAEMSAGMHHNTAKTPLAHVVASLSCCTFRSLLMILPCVIT